MIIDKHIRRITPPNDQTVHCHKSIIIEPEPLMLTLRRIVDRRPLRIVDNIVKERTIRQLPRIPRTVPDKYSRPRRRYQPVVITDTVVNAVMMPFTGSRILK